MEIERAGIDWSWTIVSLVGLLVVAGVYYVMQQRGGPRK